MSPKSELCIKSSILLSHPLPLRPCIFLDRDGVLIKEVHYISNPDHVQLESGVIDFLLLAKEYSYHTVVVTNQSGIGRGYSTWNDYDSVTSKMLYMLGEENLLTAIYANSFVDDNYFRKPYPGMLIQALSELPIDLSNSLIIGDKTIDLIAGRRAGVPSLNLVMTGHGSNEFSLYYRHNIEQCNNNFYLVDGPTRSKINIIQNLANLSLTPYAHQ